MHGEITIIEGTDLRQLLDSLGVPETNRPYSLRVWQSSDRTVAKFKINQGTWSPPLGRIDR